MTLISEAMPDDASTARDAAWAALLQGLPQAAWLVALDERRVIAANAAAQALLGDGTGPLSGSLTGRDAETLCASPEDAAWWLAQAAGDRSPLHSETLVATPSGRLLHAARSIVPLADGRHALVTLADRGAAQRIEDEREDLLAELQATLEATADGILVTDRDGRIRGCNRRFAEMLALPDELLQDGDGPALHRWLAARCADPQAYLLRVGALGEADLVVAADRIELAGGQVLERVTRPLLRAGRAQGRVWSFRDLTERIATEVRIEELALHDALTGLPNRRALAERVDEAAVAARREGGSFALLLIDLDRFGRINEGLGHDIGDRVLQTVAERIGSCLRADDLLARVTGDQFAALVHPADAGAAEATARRILNIVAQPLTLDGAPFTLTCSIGIALGPSQGARLDELARHAEAAMRSVKSSGRARFLLHPSREDGDRRAQMKLDHAMRQALVSGRFRLHYQPQVKLDDGRIVGAEALLRWRDPEMGDVPPGRFIPVAEDSGFIVAIGEWVLGQAVRQAAIWHGRGHPVPVAVNVSALQFQQPHFVDRVAGVLAVAGLPPRLLELELTESILLHDADEALQRLHALARLGVQMSIDDFGTGYSSLAYLKRFPIRKLKIDRSFIAGLPGDDSDAGIVRAILQMARALGMSVVAEGVETEAQRGFLHDEGCQEFQGWLVAPALDPMSFEQRLLAQAETPRPAGPRIRLVRG